ncbi:aminotransferase [Celeribacter arenosi]|uniref:aspartate transaminase n=1 Tax=Celeribacter arenosi TaxID=792649 RepID=A0ABP7KCZ4_9RHOB
MSLPLSDLIHRTDASPVVAAQALTKGRVFPADKPLLNVSQAAPVAPPPQGLRAEIARAALEDDDTHLYGAVLGDASLRSALAQTTSSLYHAQIAPEEVAITSGANQAFTAVMTTLAAPGDEVILPTPWYFNHKMWCDMAGVRAVPLPTGDDLLPDLESAARLIGPRTRAIVLISPNNPGGVEYPSDLLSHFFALARDRGIALILDETYRDFRADDAPPHVLFRQPDWRGTFIHLYSFSKVYRLTGHRVGAIIADRGRLAEVEKVLDTVTICPSRLGQRAASYGLLHLNDWVASERAEIIARGVAMRDGFHVLAAKGWRLAGLGGFFAYVEHPFDIPSDEVVARLVNEAHILALPGTAFRPKGDPRGARELRLAFANLDRDHFPELFARLAEFEA